MGCSNTDSCAFVLIISAKQPRFRISLSQHRWFLPPINWMIRSNLVDIITMIMLTYYLQRTHIYLEYLYHIEKYTCAGLPSSLNFSIGHYAGGMNCESWRAIWQIRAQSERTENPVGDTAGSVRRATWMETFHNYCALITWSCSYNSLNNRPSEIQ